MLFKKGLTIYTMGILLSSYWRHIIRKTSHFYKKSTIVVYRQELNKEDIQKFQSFHRGLRVRQIQSDF